MAADFYDPPDYWTDALATFNVSPPLPQIRCSMLCEASLPLFRGSLERFRSGTAQPLLSSCLRPTYPSSEINAWSCLVPDTVVVRQRTDQAQM
eukprot:1280290-Rhodomonas_salina.1